MLCVSLSVCLCCVCVVVWGCVLCLCFAAPGALAPVPRKAPVRRRREHLPEDDCVGQDDGEAVAFGWNGLPWRQSRRRRSMGKDAAASHAMGTHRLLATSGCDIGIEFLIVIVRDRCMFGASLYVWGIVCVRVLYVWGLRTRWPRGRPPLHLALSQGPFCWRPGGS